jgi:fumarylacetoacetase
LSFVISKQAKSWVFVPEHSHFPIQNLPFGVIIRDEETTVVTRIGDQLFDFRAAARENVIADDEDLYFDIETLISDGGEDSLSKARQQAYHVLLESNPLLRDNGKLRDQIIIPVDPEQVIIPMHIGAFVDFYSGINHASNVGRMFRPDMAPLLPNYRHLPVGYNGRASSVIVSGEPVIRPNGQTKRADEDSPSFGPTRELDFELELGFITGRENDMGVPIPVDEAEDYMLGVVIVNDWSARDVQRWEYQPLGPFLAKSFATSISPWLVTIDALEPFRTEGPRQEPEVLGHLRCSKPSHFNIILEVALQTPRMKSPQVLCRTTALNLYWSFAQQLAHQTSNGTPIEFGDLYASGTISGTEPGTFGSLLELSWKGEHPLVMEETGETRTFLEDGDTLSMTGYCQGDGFRVGFGEVVSTIEPAPGS